MSTENVSIITEALRRMFETRKIDVSKVKSMLTKKMITKDEYDYILGKKGVGV